MPNKLPNIVLIDGQNIHQSLKQVNEKLNLEEFTNFVKDRFATDELYWFVKHTNNLDTVKIFDELTGFGWQIMFSSSNKDMYDNDGNFIKSKSNIDGDLIVKAFIEFYEIGDFVPILGSGDGDFVPMIRHFESKNIKPVIMSATLGTTAGMLKQDRLTKIKRNIIYLDQNPNILE